MDERVTRHDEVRPEGATPEGGIVEGSGIPAEEQAAFERVCASLDAVAAATAIDRRRAGRGVGQGGRPRRFDDELVALRDEIGEARLEDVPALVAQMERLQEVSLTRDELQTVLIDRQSPYFGHLRLQERVAGRGVVERDVFIGRATFTDPKARVHIVDWRHAPVSQLYYRYAEGSDYEEKFGEREVEGDVLVRRTLTIQEGALLRIASPQGIWIKRPGAAGAAGPTCAGAGTWERIDVPVHELAGGQDTATRPARPPRPRGLLGAAPPGVQRLDRHLPEIAALIDPRQFELMTARHAGVVVIQGGAGSGKTTIGLHRLAYLGFAYPERFPPRKMLVVTHGVALAAYIDQVLPALGIAGVRVMTFRAWAEKELRTAIPLMRATITEEVPLAVARVKSHPALLHELERRAAARHARAPEAEAPAGTRARARLKSGSRAVVELWADLLTDRELLLRLVGDTPEMPVSRTDILEAHRLMVTRVNAIVSRDPRDQPHGTADPAGKPGGKLDRKRKKAIAAAVARDRAQLAEVEEQASPSSLAFFGVSAPSGSAASSSAAAAGAGGGGGGGGGKTVDSDLPEGVRRFESEREDFDDDENIRGEVGIDGLRTEDDLPILDLDDIAILLRAHQLVRRFEPPYAHLFVDEAQDLSPMKLAVLIGFTTVEAAERDEAPRASADARRAAPVPARSSRRPAARAGGAEPPPSPRGLPSITLAGDTAQKLFLDNGFGDWRAVLGHLGLAHVAVEPLRIAYRSTREILELARHAMGPLPIEAPSEAKRVGAPVEAFRFPAMGAAVAFLGEALRELAAREPRATAALIARHPEQADRYFEGLRRAEVPGLRRVRAQDFMFRPGVEVTDVRQVKGLEFDYVIMLDANASSYGADDESRHLFHIGVTRAAHQLWLVVTGSPSPLIPRELFGE